MTTYLKPYKTPERINMLNTVKITRMKKMQLLQKKISVAVLKYFVKVTGKHLGWCFVFSKSVGLGLRVFLAYIVFASFYVHVDQGYIYSTCYFFAPRLLRN